MKNITLSVDENVLATVRRRAAEKNTTVNAMVRDFLTGIASQEDRVKQARIRIREMSENSPCRLGERTWTRDDLYAR
jgi:plasmid stability protein